MAYNSLSDRLWQVNVGGDNCLHELDPAAKISTGRRICPQLATSQRGLAYDPIADLYYVGGWNDLSIHLVSPNGRVMRSIVTELATSGLAYNPVTGHLFVLTNANAGLDVYVLDTTANFAVIGGFNLAGMTDFSQAGMDMDCSGHLWAVNQVTQRVLEIESGESDACSWMQIPWLTTSVLSGTIEAASSQAVVLTFDTNLAPGVYRAQLRVRHLSLIHI